MRFGIRMEHRGRYSKALVLAKRNNWRPTATEPELPDSVAHLAMGLMKVGDSITYREGSKEFNALWLYAMGHDPASAIMAKIGVDLAELITTQVTAACVKLRRMGFRPPNAEQEIITRMNEALRTHEWR